MVIGRISDHATTIAAAVEEQTATTTEMSRSVDEVATGYTQIARGISGIAAGTQVTTAGIAENETAAAGLARMAAEPPGRRPDLHLLRRGRGAPVESSYA